MPDVQVTCTVSPCVIEVVSTNDIFNIDAAGGAQIGGAILMVWVAGWVFRQIIRALSVDEPPRVDSE